ncbi:MAG TPA: ATP-dependent RecD-like DNA helicase [Candidatus Binataceae bacterium]|nr:ATP-dependent RecD-like DNA helicase [Candidatus Binataceae bacterium]
MAESDHQDELIEGTLEQVLFVNEQSGYAVAVLERSDDELRRRVNVVGNLAGLDVGTGLRLRGRFERHPKYGEQFRVEDYDTIRPASVAALERYLAAEIKGVGPALARRIAERFGDTLPAVLDDAPERLREVRGLGAVVAERIAAAWRDSSGLRELVVFLRGNGIPAAHARRIHKLYGRDSLEIVRRDPYVLARTVAGIGFRTADAVAEKLGIPKNSIQRARAAIVFLLERMADEGHVFAPFGYLEHQFRDGLEMDPALAADALADLVSDGEVACEEVGGEGERAVYLRRLYDAEVNVARLLRRLTQGRAMGRQVVERALEAGVRGGGIELSAEQRAALRTALMSKVTVITGGPGTGKTTILRSLLAALAHAGVKPTLAAPTGRAARRLAEACGREAKTIHRLLEYSPETGGFIRGEAFPLRTSYVVIDEASMMDLELASSLLAALPAGSSLLLVGDRDQLPSVGPGSVLKDIIASGLVPVVELRQIYRQARQSLIVANAHRLNRGEMPETANDAAGDFFFFERSAPEDIVATIKQLVQHRLLGERFALRDPREIQVLTPMNRGPLGAHALNLELQALLNPAGRELRAGERALRVGDRVIQLRNDYDKLVFNGEIGRIVSIDPERGSAGVAFEDSRAEYNLAELDELGLAYAISVHKSQGSQYPAVVIPLHPSHYLMLRRNLLYTAITRAERVCVLVGTRNALMQAVRNADERRRFSRLAERLRID